MKTYHIVFKIDSEVDYFSKGENFTTEHATEFHAVLDVLAQWNDKYSQEQYPNIKFMAMYPIN
jgi:hypothetical protein